MNEELEYIKDLSEDEIVDIISNIWGFEETAEALFQLKERNPSKALVLGLSILENDKGDDYLQATVWGMIFDIDPIVVIKSLTKRDEKLEKSLLHSVIEDLCIEYYYKDLKGLPSEFIEKIKYSYKSLNNEVQESLTELYDEFISKMK